MSFRNTSMTSQEVLVVQNELLVRRRDFEFDGKAKRKDDIVMQSSKFPETRNIKKIGKALFSHHLMQKMQSHTLIRKFTFIVKESYEQSIVIWMNFVLRLPRECIAISFQNTN